jgi:hypothetical protein
MPSRFYLTLGIAFLFGVTARMCAPAYCVWDAAPACKSLSRTESQAIVVGDNPVDNHKCDTSTQTCTTTNPVSTCTLSGKNAIGECYKCQTAGTPKACQVQTGMRCTPNSSTDPTPCGKENKVGCHFDMATGAAVCDQFPAQWGSDDCRQKDCTDQPMGA